MNSVRSGSLSLKQILGMGSSPVGVRLIYNVTSIPEQVEKLSGYRYCQALMKARHGEHVLLDAEGISCPAAAAAFGFKPLPEGLKTGKGLVGFGIVDKESTGQTMFEGMAKLPPGNLKALYLFPLESANVEPIIVVVGDETEKLMWIALAYLNLKGGKRIESSTAILQATCVDATDIGNNETVLGFPYKYFNPIIESLDYHFKKALEVGCTIDQVKESVELGKMIKQRPIKDIYEHAENLISNH